jgi:hypothetical protein
VDLGVDLRISGSGPKERKALHGVHLTPKKPNSEELKLELLRCDPSARCNTLSQQALADRLLLLPPLGVGVAASGPSPNELTQDEVSSIF